jgi:conjugal transfer mating pair stabilization protein TraG
MNEFDIYTLGSGFYLEKIFNAIRLILGDEGNFISVLKFSCLGAIVVLALNAGINNDFKSTAKWFLGVTVLVSLFLTTRATVHIHDKLPDSYGAIAAPRTVENVPWGLAALGSITSRAGNAIAERFDMAFAGVFVNSDYQKTGILFGSKIVEDIGRLRIADAGVKHFMLHFYKKCIVPDTRLGHGRKNGYTVKDLVETDSILDFLKKHSSNARMVYFSGDLKRITTERKTGLLGALFGNEKSTIESEKLDGYVSCNQAAHHISDMIDYEIAHRTPMLASNFLSYFFPDNNKSDKDEVFKTVLGSSYGIFIRNASRNAKDILMQNVMINALSDTVAGAYSKVTTEETTKAAFYSVSQVAQKFVPIFRAVLECLFYGVFPLVLILMVTPIGLEVLKNYAFGFIYLQMWQPMYAILFCIAGAWGKFYALGVDSLTYATHSKISLINEQISAVAGYMLIAVPIISTYFTRGAVAGIGSLANSILHIPQSSAIQSADQAVKGNYQLGTSSYDTHSFNTATGNKHDDNYSWMSGIKSFALPSGAQEKIFSDGRLGLDSSHAVSNLAGLARIDWNKAMGSSFNQSINESMSKADRLASSEVESKTAAYSKLLGFNEDFSQGSTEYKNWQKTLTADQRKSYDYVRGVTEKIAENRGISQQNALKVAIRGNLGVGTDSLGGGISFTGSTSATKTEDYNKLIEASKDKKFTESLSMLESSTHSKAYQESNTMTRSHLESAKSDLSTAKTASLERSKTLDEVKSLQESKGAFEQNSSSISQDLSNKFSEWGIKSYGSAQFEEITRNQPEKTNEILNHFTKNIIKNKTIPDIGNQYASLKQNFRDKAVDAVMFDNSSNKEAVEATHLEDQKAVRQKSVDLDEKVMSKMNEGKKHSRGVTKDIDDGKATLKTNLEELREQGNELHDKVEKRVAQIPTQRLLQSGDQKG